MYKATKIEIIDNCIDNYYLCNVYIWAKKHWWSKYTWCFEYSHMIKHNYKEPEWVKNPLNAKDSFQKSVDFVMTRYKNIKEIHNIKLI